MIPHKIKFTRRVEKGKITYNWNLSEKYMYRYHVAV
jgi:hypothetical protein